MTPAGDPDIRTLASSVVYEDSWMALRRDEIERRDGSRGNSRPGGGDRGGRPAGAPEGGLVGAGRKPPGRR